MKSNNPFPSFAAAFKANPHLIVDEEGNVETDPFEGAPTPFHVVAGDYTRLRKKNWEMVDLNIETDDGIVTVPYPTQKGRSRFVLQLNDKGREEYTEVFEPPVDMVHFTGGRYEAGILSGFKDLLADVARGAAVEVDMYEAHLVCSGTIPMACYYRDNNAVYRSEKDAALDKQDSDGDRIGIHDIRMDLERVTYTMNQLLADGRDKTEYHDFVQAVCQNEDSLVVGLGNKFPTTDCDPPMVHLSGLPPEQFSTLPDITGWLEDEARDYAAQLTRAGELKAFTKTQQDNLTGLKTEELNVEGYLRMTQISDRNDRVRTLHVNPEDPGQRRRVIEDEGLKAISKDGVVATAVSQKTEVTSLAHKQKWFFTPNRIGTLKPVALEWMFETPIEDAVVGCMNLDMEFRTITPGKKRRSRPKIYDRGLLGRLYKLGLVGFKELPVEREGVPPAIVFWLKRPEVPYCGLTDTKRGNQLRTFCYVMPPVAMNTKDGWQIVSARTALANRLAEFNCEIKTSSGEMFRMFPQSVSDLARYKGKRSALQKFIQELCGIYGDSVPATLINGELVPTAEASSVARKTIVVDYGEEGLKVNNGPGEEDRPDKQGIIQEINKITRICISGGKGSGTRIRKFPLAHPDGRPLWAPEGVHIRRSANIRAQLLVARKARTYTVAVVKMATESVPLITPSGVEKQRITEDEQIFLPRVSPVPMVDFSEQEPSVTWAGEHVMNFVTKARDCCEVGKMIDSWGMKFVPRASGVNKATAVIGNDSFNVDLIMPIEEIQAKGCLKKFLERRDLLGSVHLVSDFFEGELRVKELWIDSVWCLEALTDDEDLSRLGTRGLRLRDLYLVE